MKKCLSLILCLLLVGLLTVPALAAPAEPVITLQPQSPNYPQYSVAMYTVKATGSNLTATWYLEWQGITYDTSGIGGAMQPWEAYAGESYGSRQLDSNTFAFIFEGIEADLDGAHIWCVLEDGHYSVTSQKARISIGNENTPPTIVDIPSAITVEQGAMAELRVIATSPDGSQLTYLWYESDTGRIEDIRAVNRGTETSDFLICDTSAPGVRNYICFIDTSAGGFAYTSFVTVTVTPKAAVAPTTAPETIPETTPETVPETTPETTAAQAATTAPETTPSATEPTEAKTEAPAKGAPWWVLVLVGVAAAGAGVGVAFLLINKKK